MSEKVVVTGGAGFIGSHLVRRLVREGYDVTVIDNFSTGLRENLADVSSRIRIVDMDILSEGAGHEFAGASKFFHLAAAISVVESVQDPIGTHETNVTGFLHMLDAARRAGVRRVVLGSSAAVYGSSAPAPVSENSALMPDSPYGLHKVIDEQYALLYQRLFGLEAVILRFFNVYGPGQRDDSPYVGVITAFTKKLRAKEPVDIEGDGSQVRDFIHVDDVVRALLLAARDTRTAGGIFNVGTGKGMSIRDLAAILSAEYGVPNTPRFVEARKGDILKSVADVSRIASVLDWHAEVDVPGGIKTILV